MVAMCLVKDQTKRPTAEKLLKHSFFKNAKPPELSLKSILADLPPLWERVKILKVCEFCKCVEDLVLFICLDDIVNELNNALQKKDAAQLALKKMPSAEQEALSQVRCVEILTCLVVFVYFFSFSGREKFYSDFIWYPALVSVSVYS